MAKPNHQLKDLLPVPLPPLPAAALAPLLLGRQRFVRCERAVIANVREVGFFFLSFWILTQNTLSFFFENKTPFLLLGWRSIGVQNRDPRRIRASQSGRGSRPETSGCFEICCTRPERNIRVVFGRVLFFFCGGGGGLDCFAGGVYEGREGGD